MRIDSTASRALRLQVRSCEKVEVLHHLLGERAAALPHLAAGGEVDPRRAQDAEDRKTAVLEEAVVLGGEHRAHHVVGQASELDRPPLLGFRAVERREQRRLEQRVAGDFAADPQRLDALAVPHHFQAASRLRPAGSGKVRRYTVRPCGVARKRPGPTSPSGEPRSSPSP
jgi:hypothetical protein